MPTSDQQLLQLSLDRFATRGREKFEAGIDEHGHAGTLVENVTPAHMEEEVIDLFHYLQADRLKRQEMAAKLEACIKRAKGIYPIWCIGHIMEVLRYLKKGEK